MGYTHYWYRQKELPKDAFTKIAEDMRRVKEAYELTGLKLRGWDGTGEPLINSDEISFNGDTSCGHRRKELGITWPAPDASGIAVDRNVISGSWFVGALLSQRTCGGDCSHETFRIPRVFAAKDWQEPKDDGTYFDCCKTAFKPYDLAVTACLVVAKHHLGDLISVSSDGGSSEWADAKKLCQGVFGYGEDVLLDFERKAAEVS